MKKTVFYLFMAIIMSTGCKQPQGTWFTIINPLDAERVDEKIILSREQVSEWQDIPANLLPLLRADDGTPIPTQVDDLDGDGSWDELVSLVNIGPLENRNIQLDFVGSDKFPDFKDRTNVRLGANEPGYPELLKADRLNGVSYENHGLTGKAFQMEGPAWENDLVGFRNYLDQRNGMDIFGKLIDKMVLDSVGIATRGSYHEPDEWGQDILKVNTSLGAGSVGFFYNDSIYRLGDNGQGTYELIMDGTLRSLFWLKFSLWKMDGHIMDVTQEIEIQGGTYYYESRVSYVSEGISPSLVTGIVNIKSDSLYTEKLNEQYTAIFTHDFQAEDTSLLGMAIMVPSELVEEIGETKDSGEGIIQTYFVQLKTEPEKPVSYRFYSFWERENPEWKDPANFVRVMKQDADQLIHPLKIMMK